MAPKFRGRSDDWLDDEVLATGAGKGMRPKKAAASARATDLPIEEANAIVAEVFPNQCRVRMKEGNSNPLCSYRRAGVVSKSKIESRERSPVAVGDWVKVNQTGQSTGVIEGICARKNCLSRPAPGRDAAKLHHVLAANVDLLVIVASVLEPEFSPGLIDRFLVAAEAEGIPALICVSKIDLALKSGSRVRPWEIYKELNYPVCEVSVRSSQGVDSLLQDLVGKVVVFCGQSGVGKTSLLRKILNADIGKVGAVNEFTGKGRHTTTGAILLEGPNDSRWIDTPGIRAFGLGKVSAENLASNFREFESLSCTGKGCIHIEEPDCEARNLPRYSSYRRIYESILSGEN